MEYTHLGRSGLRVSRLCLGTMNFGPETEEVDSHAIMDAAHEYGINYFDTANVYGGSLGRGATEEIVGNWFATGGEPVAHDLLRGTPAEAPAVDVRRVEVVDAVLVGGIHDGVRVDFLGLRTEVHGAEAKARNSQT